MRFFTRAAFPFLACLLILLTAPYIASAGTTIHPANPFKKWDAWKPMRFHVDYPVVIRRNEEALEFWFSAGNRGMDRLFGFIGPDLGSMKDSRDVIRFGADIIKGYDRPLNGIRYPLITRASCSILKDGTHIVLCAIGPKYQGGSELFPALFVSPDGKPGNWKHLGPPPGDPADYIAKARTLNGRFRIEGGSIFELPNGTLRMYIHGFRDPMELAAMKPPNNVPQKGKKGKKGSPRGAGLNSSSMFIAEAPKPEGPWRFVKDAAGRCININENLTPDCKWLFPNVMQIGEHGFMLTGGNKWPPTATYAAFSVDGIHFEIPSAPGTAPQPILRPQDISPQATSMKVLRGAFNPKTGLFEAVANISTKKGWHVHHSKTEFDLQVFKRVQAGSKRAAK